MARIEYPGSSGSKKLGALAGGYVQFLLLVNNSFSVGYFLDELGKKCSLKGATWRRIVTVQDYRMSLNFLLQTLEAIILLEIKMYKNYCMEETGKIPNFLSSIGDIDWEKVEDKGKLGRSISFLDYELD